MFRYLALLLLVPINTILAVEHHEFLRELDIEHIQLNMQHDECYLVFKGINGFLIKKEKVSTFLVDLQEVQSAVDTINHEVALYENNPFSHDPTIFIEQAKFLYIELLSPVKNELASRIHIIPTIEYDMIPWNSLVSEPGEFLIDLHEISIKKSIEALVGSKYGKKQLRMLIVAPVFSGNLALNSTSEQEEINKIIPNQVSSWETCDVLHISSHGRIDTSDWLESGILMSDEVVFRNEEISSLCLDTELVFLNVCDGAKKWKHNKSIVDAFEEAGAKSTIGALWQVNDQFAVQLSEQFYKELIKGKRSGEALRNSVLWYKNNSDLSSDLHPLRWSGYQLYGENTEVVAYQYIRIKRVLSVILSIFTTFSLLFYYFGNQILERITLHELT